MLNSADFLTEYPDFDSIPIHQIELALKYGAVLCPASRWGDKADFGIKFVAAHKLTMEWLQTSQVAGAASAIGANQSVSSPVGSENDFTLTHYGRMYLELRNTLVGRIGLWF